jgi:DNA invertase Pin-like site-specific DNA recombinase
LNQFDLVALLLGLKGTISERELHTIRSRLTAGLIAKAERRELALALPIGLVRIQAVWSSRILTGGSGPAAADVREVSHVRRCGRGSCAC